MVSNMIYCNNQHLLPAFSNSSTASILPALVAQIRVLPQSALRLLILAPKVIPSIKRIMKEPILSSIQCTHPITIEGASIFAPDVTKYLMTPPVA